MAISIFEIKNIDIIYNMMKLTTSSCTMKSHNTKSYCKKIFAIKKKKLKVVKQILTEIQMIYLFDIQILL